MNAVNTTLATAATPAAPAIKTLADSFSIFTYTPHRYGGQRTDKRASDEVTTSKRAAKNAAKVVKSLFANEPLLDTIVAHDAAFKNMLYATYPSAGRSAYFISTLEIPVFRLEKLNPYLIKREALVTEFVDKLDTLISAAAFTQGEMFNRDDYPSASELIRAFSVDLYLDPVPTDHWIVQHTQTAAQTLTDTLSDLYSQGMTKRIGEITDVVQRKLVDSLEWAAKACEERELGEDGKLKRKPIHESSVRAFLGLTDLLRKLNVNNDPKLNAVAESFEVLFADTTVPALTEALKSDPVMRETVREQVKAVRSLLDF
jgi:hypothetical protein